MKYLSFHEEYYKWQHSHFVGCEEGFYMEGSHKRSGFTLIEIMIVVLIIAMLLCIALPNFLKAKEMSRSRTCQSNLRIISTAKEQWAIDFRKSSVATPTSDELVSEYIKGYEDQLPGCPQNGSYSIGDLETRPSCSIGTNSTTTDWDDHLLVQ